MKTLIIYTTKYGATCEVAQRIASKLSDVSIYDVKKDKIPSLTQFDRIIIGSSLYAGMINKEVKNFITQNANILSEKKIGLFLSGLEPRNEEAYFKDNFSEEILNIATSKAFLGGIFDPAKVGFFGRMIMKMVSKNSDYINNISDENISKFIENLSIS